MKKILLISHQFSPDTGSIQRILNFIKFLPKYGFLPCVLTHKSNLILSKKIDKDFLENNIKIYRTGQELNIQSFISQKVTVNYESDNRIVKKNSFKSYTLPIIKNILKRIKNFVIWPDNKILWVFFAFIKAFKIIKKEKINIVYIVTPPHSSSLIGLLLKLFINIKLIVDFRDPWANDIDIIMPTKFHKFLHRYFEKLVLRISDSVLVTTNYHKQYFNKIINHDHNKIHVITNGYNSSDFNNLTNKKSNIFSIVHTGNFDMSRNPNSFLKAISNITIKFPEIFKDNSIKFFGNFNPIVQNKINKLKINNIVKQFGMINYQDAINEMSASSVLLLVVHNDPVTPKFCIPAKLFEYMATNRPILSISPKGAASDIIEKYKIGINIPHHEVEEIEQQLISYYKLFLKDELNNNKIDKRILEKYDRENLTNNFSTILNNL